MTNLTTSKTVRFDPITFLKVQKAAEKLSVCTSEYIRELVTTSVALVNIEDHT